MQVSRGATAVRTPRGRAAVFGTLGAVFVVGYAADQASKYWAEHHLVRGVSKPLLGDFLRLHLTYNPGAAFSLGTGLTWVLTTVACGVVLFTAWTARRLRSVAWAAALGLLLAGACGNLTDRWFRSPGPARGHVVDFLRLPAWPIFNVADVCIVSAAVLISVLALRGITIEGGRADERGSTGDVDEAPADQAVVGGAADA